MRKLRRPLNDAILKMAEIYKELEFNSSREVYDFHSSLCNHLLTVERVITDQLRAKDDERNERRKDTRISLDKRCAAWIEKYGFPGLFIKVTGSRDGRGYREIISMDYDRHLMTCYQLDRNGERIGIVEIMFNKFRGLLNFGEHVDAGPNSFRRAYIKNIDELEKLSEQAARNVALNSKWRDVY